MTMLSTLRFPWRVGVDDRNGRPRIMDADNKVVCEMSNGDKAAAELIVQKVNSDD